MSRSIVVLLTDIWWPIVMIHAGLGVVLKIPEILKFVLKYPERSTVLKFVRIS